MKIDFLTPPGGGGWGLKKIGFFCKNGEKIGFFCKNPARNWVVLIRFQTAKRVFYPKKSRLRRAHKLIISPDIFLATTHLLSVNLVGRRPEMLGISWWCFTSGIWRFLLSRKQFICIQTRQYPPMRFLRAAFDASYYRENDVFVSGRAHIHLVLRGAFDAS